MRWIGIIGILKVIYRRLFLLPVLFLVTGILNCCIYVVSKFFSTKNVLRRIIIFGFLFGFLIASGVTFYAYKVWHEEFDIKKLTEYRPVMSSQILDKDGNVIAEIAKEKRIFVSIDDISKNAINAFISAEDRTFYTNPGIDIFGLSRAMIMNGVYLMSGKRLHGASTITQQVVRNTILSNERTLTRKIKEMILSYKISKIASKNQIMQVYLNHIYLGQKSYGIQAASQEYFGKDCKNLTIEEAALIASLTKAPSSLDPRKGKAATLDRRNWIIRGMFEQGYITKEEMEKALEAPIKLVQKKHNDNKPYSYIDYITRYLETQKGITKADLENNGYTIKTSFDSQIYKLMYNAFNKGIKDYDKKHGYKGPIGVCEEDFEKCIQNFDEPDLISVDQKIALVTKIIDDENVEILIQNLEKGEIKRDNFKWAKPRLDDMKVGKEIKKTTDVFKVGDVIIVQKTANEGEYKLDQIPDVNGGIVVIEPGTGKIYSMMGGYLDVPGAFNRVTQAKRQPGSVAKVFSYLTALESGFKLNDVVLDSEIQIATGNGTAWMPKNSTNNFSNGVITVRRAFEKSLNSPLARIMNEVGPRKLVTLLKRLEITDSAEENLSTVLGSFDTTLIGITKGFATMLNLGTKVIDEPILSISQGDEGKKYSEKDLNDKKLENTTEEVEIIDELSDSKILSDNEIQEISPENAYQICSLLEGSVRRGTSSKFAIAPNLFGKTGTSNEAKDVWFIGGSTDFVIGVYIGKDQPSTLGDNEFGGTVALPVAKDVMAELIKIKAPQPIAIPDGIKFAKVNLETGEVLSNSKAGLDVRVINEVFLKSDLLGSPKSESEIFSQIENNEDIAKSKDISGVY